MKKSWRPQGRQVKGVVIPALCWLWNTCLKKLLSSLYSNADSIISLFFSNRITICNSLELDYTVSSLKVLGFIIPLNPYEKVVSGFMHTVLTVFLLCLFNHFSVFFQIVVGSSRSLNLSSAFSSRSLISISSLLVSAICYSIKTRLCFFKELSG